MSSASILALLFIVAVSSFITVIDLRLMIIPDALNLILAIGGVLAATWLPAIGLQASILGMLVGGLGSWALRQGYYRLRSYHGLGLGDVKLLAAAGVWTGPEGLAPLLLIASLSALVFALVRSLQGKPLGPTQRLAFGPFLCLGLLGVALPQIIGQQPFYDLALP